MQRNFQTIKSQGEQDKAKGKVFHAPAKIKCAKTVFICFIPILEWLYRKCSCKKLKLFLNMVSWWFRNNCKYMLWIFLNTYIYIYVCDTHTHIYTQSCKKCIRLLVQVCSNTMSTFEHMWQKQNHFPNMASAAQLRESNSQISAPCILSSPVLTSF